MPLAAWGLAGYVALLGAIGTPLLLPLAALAAAAAIALAAISALVLHVLCPLCAATWVVDFAILALAWRERRAAAMPRRPWRLVALAAAAVAILVAARLAAPPLSPLVSWREGVTLPHGIDASWHPWMGAAKPRLVIEEYIDYGCPHCRRAHAALRHAIEQNAQAARLVRHDYARMACLPVPPARHRAARCQSARIALCAGDQGRFWEMSDWLFARASPGGRIDSDAAARDVGIDAPRLRACLDDPRSFERAHREQSHAKAARVRGTPSFVSDGKKLSLAEALSAIRDAH